jgi:putative ABC transport system permease protein
LSADGRSRSIPDNGEGFFPSKSRECEVSQMAFRLLIWQDRNPMLKHYLLTTLRSISKCKYVFLDTFFNRQRVKQFGQVFGFFAMLASFVASLGLFGLASCTTAQRTKEIGIRKVLASSVSIIFLLRSTDFLKLVVIANLIAIPLVWSLMNEWLSIFAFHVDITFWIFVIAAVTTTFIALVTVSYQSISAAIANPVKSLRYE